MINKFRLLDSVRDLSLVKKFIENSNKVTLYGELEIEPFTEFSLPFQAQYWYLKFMLLQNGKLDIVSNEHRALYEETNLNIIWLSVRNHSKTIIECKDGEWIVRLSEQDERNKFLLKNYKLSIL